MKYLVLVALIITTTTSLANADASIDRNLLIIDNAIKNCNCKQNELNKIRQKMKDLTGTVPDHLPVESCQFMRSIERSVRYLNDAREYLRQEEQHLLDFERNYRVEERGGSSKRLSSGSDIKKALKEGRKYKVKVWDKKYLDLADAAYDNANLSFQKGTNIYKKWLDRPHKNSMVPYSNRKRIVSPDPVCGYATP